MTLLQERFAEVGPITAMEAQLARAAVAARGRLDERDETAIRYALALTRCWHVRAPDGRDVAVAAVLRPFREKLVQVLCRCSIRSARCSPRRTSCCRRRARPTGWR